MKISKNLNLLLRLFIIPGFLLLIMLLIIKAPSWFNALIHNEHGTAPPVASFGIIIPKGYTVHGIDVSKHQGDIDWKRVSLMENNGSKFIHVYRLYRYGP